MSTCLFCGLGLAWDATLVEGTVAAGIQDLVDAVSVQDSSDEEARALNQGSTVLVRMMA